MVSIPPQGTSNSCSSIYIANDIFSKSDISRSHNAESKTTRDGLIMTEDRQDTQIVIDGLFASCSQSQNEEDKTLSISSSAIYEVATKKEDTSKFKATEDSASEEIMSSSSYVQPRDLPSNEDLNDSSNGYQPYLSMNLVTDVNFNNLGFTLCTSEVTNVHLNLPTTDVNPHNRPPSLELAL